MEISLKVQMKNGKDWLKAGGSDAMEKNAMAERKLLEPPRTQGFQNDKLKLELRLNEMASNMNESNQKVKGGKEEMASNINQSMEMSEVKAGITLIREQTKQ